MSMDHEALVERIRLRNEANSTYSSNIRDHMQHPSIRRLEDKVRQREKKLGLLEPPLESESSMLKEENPAPGERLQDEKRLQADRRSRARQEAANHGRSQVKPERWSKGRTNAPKARAVSKANSKLQARVEAWIAEDSSNIATHELESKVEDIEAKLEKMKSEVGNRIVSAKQNRRRQINQQSSDHDKDRVVPASMWNRSKNKNAMRAQSARGDRDDHLYSLPGAGGSLSARSGYRSNNAMAARRKQRIQSARGRLQSAPPCTAGAEAEEWSRAGIREAARRASASASVLEEEEEEPEAEKDRDILSEEKNESEAAAQPADAAAVEGVDTEAALDDSKLFLTRCGLSEDREEIMQQLDKQRIQHGYQTRDGLKNTLTHVDEDSARTSTSTSTSKGSGARSKSNSRSSAYAVGEVPIDITGMKAWHALPLHSLENLSLDELRRKGRVPDKQTRSHRWAMRELQGQVEEEGREEERQPEAEKLSPQPEEQLEERAKENVRLHSNVNFHSHVHCSVGSPPAKTPNVIVPVPRLSVKPAVAHQHHTSSRLAAPKNHYLAGNTEASGTEAARKASLVANAAKRAKAAGGVGGIGGGEGGNEPATLPVPTQKHVGTGQQYLRGVYSHAQEERIATAARTYRIQKRRAEMKGRMAAQKRVLEDLMLAHGGTIVAPEVAAK